MKLHLQGQEENGILYLVRLTDRDENFLKLGYTTDMQVRFAAYRRAGYQVNLIHNLFEDKVVLLHHEDILVGRNPKVLSPFSDFRYVPLKEFGGRTECFQLAALRGLCEYMDDLFDPMVGIGDLAEVA